MKSLFTVIFLVLFSLTVVQAVEVQDLAKHAVTTKAKEIEKRTEDSPEIYAGRPVNIITTSAAAANLPGTKVGETAYNYQTNDNLHDRIWYDTATNTIHVQWMYGDIAETPTFQKRRMRYNYFDGSSWVHGLGIPVENERAGYGSLAVDNNNVAVPISHHTITNEEATRVWYDFAAGFGFFSMSKVWNAREDGTQDLEPFWPDIAVDDADVWHVTATNNNQDDWVQLINDVNDNIMYWRSTDRGQTWSDWKAMFPDTSTYRLTTGASGANEAGSHQVEVSDNGNGKVGVLVANPGHDFYFFESDDRGVTFKDAIQIVGNTFPDPEDSLSYPMKWDVVVDYDSTTVAPIDTLLYPFTRDTETDTLTPLPNIFSTVHGPADLLYVNGEAHVVWNELVHTGENTFYPNGYGTSWTTPYRKFLNGDSTKEMGGFAIKHWSPSTGISIIYHRDETTDVWPGTFQQFVTMPQIGVDASGNLYCLFTKYSETDTLREEDGVTQAELDYGPLSFGRIMGAKSTDGGETWGEVVQLISEQDADHQNLRYIAVANRNGDDAVHILYQNTPDLPGVSIGENSDHNQWKNADMIHWAIPTSSFPTTRTDKVGPVLALETSSKFGGIDFGDIGDAGSATSTFVVKNLGDEDLVVTGAFTSDADVFAVNPTDFTIAPGGSQEVEVKFTPRSEDPYENVQRNWVVLPNNDFNDHSAGIPLQGSGVPTPVGVADHSATPTYYDLAQNYPNPFNPSTAIQFSMVKDGKVTLTVFNTIGEEVAVLVNDHLTAGTHSIDWQPDGMSSGVYFYRLSAGDYTATKKMILMR